ncbi:hypothetical protein [Leisingera sp. F5]|uniref:hypothetical protein n=1 Tax=Leisingera sp. F5 TaxID=1813816 RepID=UPI000ABF8662|nr:hypothetical protein [Leisingera sp. F5]
MMDWAKVVVHLQKMSGRHLVAADRHPDPEYRQEHKSRAVLADLLSEAFMSGLSDEDMRRLPALQDSDK